MKLGLISRLKESISLCRRKKASLVTQIVKNLSATWETWVRSLDWEDPLEKGKATCSSTLAWRIPMDRDYSPWGRKELDTTE